MNCGETGGDVGGFGWMFGGSLTTGLFDFVAF